MRHLSVCLQAALLWGLFAFASPALAADLPQDASATVSDDQGSLTVSFGAKYLMPQDYNGADAIVNGTFGNIAGQTHIKSPRGFYAPSVSLAAERKTLLTLPGLKDIRLVGDFNYVGGSGRNSGTQSAGVNNYFVALSIDPASNWLGGLFELGGTARTRVSVAVDNFDMSLGFEGRTEGWQFSGGGALTPVFGAGIFASTQRYRVSTRLSLVSNDGESDSLVETIRTTDVGPELRAGLAAQIPGGITVSATANAALLVGWADLDASQDLTSSIAWNSSGRSSVPHATQGANERFMSGLFGLTLRGEIPIAEKLTLGLDATARYWTSRPTIENPTTLTGGGSVLTSPSINQGVRIGYDSAAELGAAL